jgi:hypothetical protein
MPCQHQVLIQLNRHMEASRLYAALGQHKEALEHAERGLLLDKDCLGVDHPIYQETLRVVQTLRGSRASVDSATKTT